MAPVARYLVDNSALARAALPAIAETLDHLARRGEIATCSIIDLELGYSARSGNDHATIQRNRTLLPRAPVDQSTFDRALEVQSLLARKGQHRVSLPDLVIAACAEHNELTILHYDKDFDTIATVTGQSVLWVAPRGSL